MFCTSRVNFVIDETYVRWNILMYFCSDLYKSKKWTLKFKLNLYKINDRIVFGSFYSVFFFSMDTLKDSIISNSKDARLFLPIFYNSLIPASNLISHLTFYFNSTNSYIYIYICNIWWCNWHNLTALKCT